MREADGVHDHHDHDHQHCRTTALERAERLCGEKGLRLTAQRRMVLDVMLESHAPVTAYEIMDRIAEVAHRPSPISVYRALDFLVANGFVHRIESRNAFIACIHQHDAGDPVVFLLCDQCGAVGEAGSEQLAGAVKAAARTAGFTPKTPVIEIAGVCAHCRGAG